ncbi:hypothetical protein [Kingella negevensis]|uniref:hypothetical protein n=1 Tax=Kingella negevensis TaxID=1522312 RepID=UPI0012FD11F1|nr:hypothetical protein [Kingella negevensis]MDK4688759.1 hypothetical protein [Kingella negevensis]WII90115.1 hypothetical protein QEO93_06385 [Kingella negevensis]
MSKNKSNQKEEPPPDDGSTGIGYFFWDFGLQIFIGLLTAGGIWTKIGGSILVLFVLI